MPSIDGKTSVIQDLAGLSERQVAALRNRADFAQEYLARLPFGNRGFSDRTINVLVAGGIDAPERLLFVTEAGLRQISGVGPTSLREIMRYRARFLPEPAEAGEYRS